MQYEIDYMPVGNGSKGGDAIALRYGDFSHPSAQTVVIIDGGTKDSGKMLVDHVKSHYGTNRINLVVASHLHTDHISGLTVVLEELDVEKIAVHCPWDFMSSLKKMTHTQSTLPNLKTKLEKSLSGLSTLIDIATSKNIPIIQPFQGEKVLEEMIVLGPSKEYYLELLANFGVTPEARKEHKIGDIFSAVKTAVSWIAEELHIETLSDDYEDTSVENNSSLILLLTLDDERFLFTGDAGKESLNKIIEYTESIKKDSLNNIDFLDVPHHGSKRNLGPTILNHLMPKTAFISTPPEGDPKHPSRKVCNALRRRGCPPLTTKSGNTLCHPGPNSPDRGWGPAEPEPFYHKVDK